MVAQVKGVFSGGAEFVPLAVDGRSVRQGWCLSLFLFILLGFFGCALPTQKVKPPAMVKPSEIDATLERFRRDQLVRLNRFGSWYAEGIMDLTTVTRREESNHRGRFRLVGDGTDQALLEVYGPFHRVMMSLWLGREWVRLVDPDTRRVLEAPATREGLFELAGIFLEPRHLLLTVLGMVGSLPEDLSISARVEAEGLAWLSPGGESFRLDPERGLIRQRWGATGNGGWYQADYEWEEKLGDPEKGAELVMPSRLRVAMTDGTELVLVSPSWGERDSSDPLEPPPLPEGFQRVRLPQGASGG
ncbi:MAG: hypothetical protein HQL57_00240 [Magnetococcales bacterium]|nr:hypothetical protein [Magnetococcales bacterium]MBF0155602.1 hypothetical protein [Magnetococcales bacterium]